MEQVKRKFRSDISATCVDKLIEKRQRKRSHFVNKTTPYGGAESTRQQAGPNPSPHWTNKTLVDSIPLEMLSEYQRLKSQRPKRESEIPERWLMPAKKEPISRDDNLATEEANILKRADSNTTWSRATRILIRARGQKLIKPSDRLTAKGYLSTRSDNKRGTGRNKEPKTQ